jgi:proteasome accessory factor C
MVAVDRNVERAERSLGDDPVSTRRGPLSVEEKLPRLLSVLSWLAERPGEDVPLAEIAARFEIPEASLIRDLEQISMAGLPPYSADELFDLIVDDETGTVMVGVPRFVTRPLRLDAREAFDLLVRARAASSLPGVESDGPLARALAKLERHLGETGVDVALDQPAIAADLAAGIEQGDEFDIEHWSPARGSISERTIVPRLVFNDRGAWYVLADDDRSGEARIFRLDRVLSCAPTGRSVGARTVRAPDTDAWFDDETATVTLQLDQTARWVVERYPTRSVSDLDDGTIEAVLAVVDDAWLRSLLLRLGHRARVVAPEHWRSLAADAAGELLAARYAAD